MGSRNGWRTNDGGPMGGGGFGSGMRGGVPRAGGRGWRGMLGRVGGFLGRHSGKVGMALGAGVGYLASDGDLYATLGGGLAGGVAGRMMKGRRCRWSSLTPEQTLQPVWPVCPVFGTNCVPVCIVGGMENLMGGGLMNMVGNGMNIADTAMDARGLYRSVRGLDKVDDAAGAAAKGGGWMSKIWHW